MKVYLTICLKASGKWICDYMHKGGWKTKDYYTKMGRVNEIKRRPWGLLYVGAKYLNKTITMNYKVYDKRINNAINTALIQPV